MGEHRPAPQGSTAMLWQVITLANVAIAIAYFSIAWDIFGATVAFYYLSLRGSYASVLRGAQMFEDFKVRERQALEINDNIVQGLAVAKMALESGDDADTRTA